MKEDTLRQFSHSSFLLDTRFTRFRYKVQSALWSDHVIVIRLLFLLFVGQEY